MIPDPYVDVSYDLPEIPVHRTPKPFPPMAQDR